MTIQSIIFLCKAKRAQILESGRVCIVSEPLVLRTVHGDGEEFVSVKVKKTAEELRPMLEYLEKQDLLEIYNDCFFSLTHSGFYYLQTLVSAVLKFLLTSVAVPIAVALITTLISLWLTGVFTPSPAPQAILRLSLR